MKNKQTISHDIQLEILDLIENGWSTEDIALHLDIPKEQVSK